MPFDRYLFFIRVKKWWSVARALLWKNVLWCLWALTIVGGWIKHYSYLLVPYILAENPETTGRQAVALSRTMMNGHKWEAFVISLSMLGWYILDVATLGVSSLFWTNAYRQAIFSEFFVRIRAGYLAENPKAETVFDNPYLYRLAPRGLLEKAYAKEIVDMKKINPIQNAYTGFKGFLERNFGLVFRLSSQERAYERYNFTQWDLKEMKWQVERKEYPIKLSPIPEIRHRHVLRSLYPGRNYTVTSVALLFFFM